MDMSDLAEGVRLASAVAEQQDRLATAGATELLADQGRQLSRAIELVGAATHPSSGCDGPIEHVGRGRDKELAAGNGRIPIGGDAHVKARQGPRHFPSAGRP